MKYEVGRDKSVNERASAMTYINNQDIKTFSTFVWSDHQGVMCRKKYLSKGCFL